MKQLEESAARRFGTMSDSAVSLSCADGSMSKGMSISVNCQLASGFNRGPPTTKSKLDEFIWRTLAFLKINASYFNTHPSWGLVALCNFYF